jgi:peptide/nickel transport system ATP-binding protein
MSKSQHLALRVVNLEIIDTRTRHRVVGPVNFQLERGECVGLIGDSGSGKTLILRALMNLLPDGLIARSEVFEINGVDAQTLSAREWDALRGETITLVQQDSGQALDPLQRVNSAVLEATPTRKQVWGCRESTSARKKYALSLLSESGFDDAEAVLRRWPGELSGGQRQRVVLAAALSGNPQIVLADEPTTALDASVQRQVMEALGRQKNQQRSLVLVSHDAAVVGQVADRVVVVHNGVIVSERSHDHSSSNVSKRREPSRLVVESGAKGLPILHASEVSARYPSGAGVSNVTLTLHAGKILGVLGKSGAGKSTLAKALACVIPLVSGCIVMSGTSWSDLSEKDRRTKRWRMQWVPQDALASFARGMSVQEILHEAVRTNGSFEATAHHSRVDLDRRAEQLLRRVGLDTSFLRRRPRRLSGGQQQRVAIARALAGHPEVLICDEAVSALDASSKEELLKLLRSLADEDNCAVLFISHDVDAVAKIADEIMVLSDGQVVESGLAPEVLNQPKHVSTQNLLRDSGYRDG